MKASGRHDLRPSLHFSVVRGSYCTRLNTTNRFQSTKVDEQTRSPCYFMVSTPNHCLRTRNKLLAAAQFAAAAPSKPQAQGGGHSAPLKSGRSPGREGAAQSA